MSISVSIPISIHLYLYLFYLYIYTFVSIHLDLLLEGIPRLTDAHAELARLREAAARPGKPRLRREWAVPPEVGSKATSMLVMFMMFTMMMMMMLMMMMMIMMMMIVISFTIMAMVMNIQLL